MDSLTTYGAILGGLTVLLLARLLAAFQELRGELLAQRERVLGLEEALAAATRPDAALRAEDLGPLEQRLELLESRAVAPSYEEATRLVRAGATEQRLADDCGLSPGEARLVRVMWEQQKNVGGTTRSLGN